MVGEIGSVSGAGGLAATFCFAKGTPVSTSRGVTPIEKIKIGDYLFTGSKVVGTMQFQKSSSDLYTLHNIIVSGTHIVYQNNHPIHVKDHPDAKPYTGPPQELYCLMTSDKQIPIVTHKGLILFADWEEITNIEDLKQWHKQVYETLNPLKQYEHSVETNTLYSESVFSENTPIRTLHGSIPIKDIRPGEEVLDEYGNITVVEGVVEVDSLEVHSASSIGNDNYMSSAAWIKEYDEWKQIVENPVYPKNANRWFSLFTKTGTFQILRNNDTLPARDFTDIGPDHIHETYDWVLQSLWNQKQKLATK